MSSSSSQILLMAENIHQAESYKEILGNKFVFVNIHDFYKAINYLDEKHFDILLMDLALKNPGNLNFLKKFHGKYPNIPLLIIFSEFDEEITLKAFEYGAQDYLIKGEFTPETLKRSIFNVVKKKEIQLQLREKAEKLIENNKTFNDLNLISEVPKDFNEALHELQVHHVELEIQNEEMRKTSIELEESRNKFQDLYDFAPVGYLTMDEKGIILDANLTGASLLNLEKNKLVDRAFILFLNHSSRRIFHKLLNKIFKTRTRQICQMKITPNGIGGESFDAQLEIAPVFHENGNFKELRTILTDVTEIKKIENELQRYRENLEEQIKVRTKELENANIRLKSMINQHEETEIELENLVDELKRSNKELEQFAYIASHDLQEPLRMVSSFTQLLERQYGNKLDKNAREYIKYAVDGAKRMQTLINDLLAYSRITTKGTKFTQVNMREIVNQAIFNLEITIEENNATVKVDSLPEIKADHFQMVQLFQNLIGNAIKYRSNKSPVINISAHKDKGEWIFMVTDNGVGISAEYYGVIFKIFQRLHEIHLYSGTGMGLAICKKIVERHGGQIWVDSSLDNGSTFYFSIPEVNFNE